MGSECLRGKSDLKQRVRRALELNREYKPDYVFYRLNNADTDPDGFLDRLKNSKLDYPYESVSRAMRKAREELDGLKDIKYYERQLEAKYVRTEIVKDTHLNDYEAVNGDLLDGVR